MSEEKEVATQISEYLDKGLIRPSYSSFASPVILVKKKHGTYRMCIDYRVLNKITVKHNYPMPRVDDLLDSIGHAKIFSQIDLKSGYHQIRIRDEDIPKTSFRTRYGHYEFLVLPFVLCNAPATFMMLMNDVFRPVLGDFVVDFVDDILVFSKTLNEHITHLHTMFGILKDHSLYINEKKTFLCQEVVEYLGHLIFAHGVRMDPSKVSVILSWQAPKNV
jgi:hypothetical protein